MHTVSDLWIVALMRQCAEVFETPANESNVFAAG